MGSPVLNSEVVSGFSVFCSLGSRECDLSALMLVSDGETDE